MGHSSGSWGGLMLLCCAQSQSGQYRSEVEIPPLQLPVSRGDDIDEFVVGVVEDDYATAGRLSICTDAVSVAIVRPGPGFPAVSAAIPLFFLLELPV